MLEEIQKKYEQECKKTEKLQSQLRMFQEETEQSLKEVSRYQEQIRNIEQPQIHLQYENKVAYLREQIRSLK